MTDLDFNERVADLHRTECREDYEATLYELCMTCTIEQCAVLRREVADQKLWSSKPWRNPTDYDRSDLTWAQRLHRGVAKLAIQDGATADYRDDLCALAWLYHNLLLSGVDADAALLNVACRADARIAALIRGFVNRDTAHKSMEAFRLAVENTADGPRAVQRP